MRTLLLIAAGVALSLPSMADELFPDGSTVRDRRGRTTHTIRPGYRELQVRDRRGRTRHTIRPGYRELKVRERR